MVSQLVTGSLEPPPAQLPIPIPEEIERRLYDLKLEAGLLRRLLRVSRDRQILIRRNAKPEVQHAS